jgi:hypothetical protein
VVLQVDHIVVFAVINHVPAFAPVVVDLLLDGVEGLAEGSMNRLFAEISPVHV